MTKLNLRINELLEVKGKTQAEMSRESGLRVATISKYRNQFTKSLDIETLCKIIDYFEVTDINQLIEIIPDDTNVE